MTSDVSDEVRIAGQTLRCYHCGGTAFHGEQVTLGRMVGGLFHLDGARGRHPTTFVCNHCGFVHFFYPSENTVEWIAKDSCECLSCGEEIPGDAKICPACGWTWTPVAGESDE